MLNQSRNINLISQSKNGISYTIELRFIISHTFIDKALRRYSKIFCHFGSEFNFLDTKYDDYTYRLKAVGYYRRAKPLSVFGGLKFFARQ